MAKGNIVYDPDELNWQNSTDSSDFTTAKVAKCTCVATQNVFKAPFLTTEMSITCAQLDIFFEKKFFVIGYPSAPPLFEASKLTHLFVTKNVVFQTGLEYSVRKYDVEECYFLK